MSTVDALVTWLRTQLDTDERVARAVPSQRWHRETAVGDRNVAVVLDETGWTVASCGVEGLDGGEFIAEHIARHDQARVLAEVDAKRRILDVYRADVIDVSVIPGHPEWIHGAAPVEAHTVLRLLALPYADRPGYRDEWRPA